MELLKWSLTARTNIRCATIVRRVAEVPFVVSVFTYKYTRYDDNSSYVTKQ